MNPQPPNPHWILVTTHHGKERLAVQNIARQGYEYFLPMYREIRTTPNAPPTQVARPLFPRYVFVQIQQRWSPLTGTYGISGLVMDGKAPKIVPQKILTSLQARQDAEGFIVLDEPPKHPNLPQTGQPVKILSGPLQDHIGIYQGMTPDERAIILFRLLGSSHTVPLPPKILLAV